MNIALIRRRFDASGGAELYTQRLIEALHGSGHEVHLYAEAWEGLSPEIRLHRIECRESRARRAWGFAEAVRQTLNPGDYDCVFSLERTLRQDVYRAGDGVHRVWLERRSQFAPWWKRWMIGFGAFHRNLLALERETFSPLNTGRIIVNSEMVRGEIARHFAYPQDRIHTIRNGVRVQRFMGVSRAAARGRWGYGERDYVMLFAGSGWERKGLRYALEAARRLEAAGVSLLVVGKGKIPRFAPRNVRFAGPMRDIEHAYAAADLLLCLPIYEPSANVVCEALASQLPVVTCIQNGASEWLSTPGSGEVVEDPSDVGNVMRAIERVRAQKSSRVLVDLEALSLERNVRETVALLERARE